MQFVILDRVPPLREAEGSASPQRVTDNHIKKTHQEKCSIILHFHMNFLLILRVALLEDTLRKVCLGFHDLEMISTFQKLAISVYMFWINFAYKSGEQDISQPTMCLFSVGVFYFYKLVPFLLSIYHAPSVSFCSNVRSTV